jgi:hypothetical protein
MTAGPTMTTEEIDPKRDAISQLRGALDDIGIGAYNAASWRINKAIAVIEMTISSAEGSDMRDDLLQRLRDYLDINARSGNDLAPKFSAEITAILKCVPADRLSAQADVRAATIAECLAAARQGFETAMGQYVVIGPSGMAMMMLNSIRALKGEA